MCPLLSQQTSTPQITVYTLCLALTIYLPLCLAAVPQAYLLHVIHRLITPAAIISRKGGNSVVQCAQSAAGVVAGKSTSYLSVYQGDNPWTGARDKRFSGNVCCTRHLFRLLCYRFACSLHLHMFTSASPTHNAVALEMEEAHSSQTTPWWKYFLQEIVFQMSNFGAWNVY
jgi:hypothetical protein